jgi:hypothetical protein
VQDALYDPQTTTTARRSSNNQARVFFIPFISLQSWGPCRCPYCDCEFPSRNILKYHFWHEHRIIGKEHRDTHKYSAQIPLYIACSYLDSVVMLANHFNSRRTQSTHHQQPHATVTVTRYARFPFGLFILYHGGTGSLLHLRSPGQQSLQVETSYMAGS